MLRLKAIAFHVGFGRPVGSSWPFRFLLNFYIAGGSGLGLAN
ncbi:hypothetical protein NC652_023430 [Populus alba x Populus x berolinensis]|nr:hypothetical protein NC652_023430 [Populus alba x Populus x berolinensis]